MLAEQTNELVEYNHPMCSSPIYLPWLFVSLMGKFFGRN